MQIKLKVVQCPPESEMTGQVLSIDESGATIGRAATNTFALPDVNRYVSSLHAKIDFNGQRFEITDQSTNGTFLNNLSQALVKGQATPLSPGDQILMGPFVLEVMGEGGAQAASGSDADTTSVSATLSGLDSLSVASDAPAGGLDDLDKWLEPSAPEAAPKPAPSVIPDKSGADDSLISGGDRELDPLAALGGQGKSSHDHDDLGLGLGQDANSPQEAPPQEGGLLDGGRMDLGMIPDDWDKSIVQPASPRKPAAARPPQKPSKPAPEAPPAEAPVRPEERKPAASDAGSLLDLVNTPEDKLSKPSDPVHPSTDPVPPATDSGVLPTTDGSEEEQDFFADASSSQPAPSPTNEPPIPRRDPLSDSLLEERFGAEMPRTDHLGETPWVQEGDSSTAKEPAGGVNPLTEEFFDQPSAEPSPARPAKTATAETGTTSPESSAPPGQGAGKMSAGEALALAEALGLADMSAEQRAALTPVVGEVVKVCVEGLMQALRARQTIKNEFRMNLTMIQAAENNPLKFSLSPDDALENLFVKRGKAYLSAVDATKEAFADISDHQLALFNGIRGAYDHLMSHFSPEKLEKRFARQRGKSLFGGSGKNWEAYQDFFEEMNEDPEKAFRNLFGETFAEHYERSFNELKGKRRK